MGNFDLSQEMHLRLLQWIYAPKFCGKNKQ